MLDLDYCALVALRTRASASLLVRTVSYTRVCMYCIRNERYKVDEFRESAHTVSGRASYSG